MFPALLTVKRRGKTYQYARLLETFRTDDGAVRQRIVANLGACTALEFENLREAFAASKKGKRVVLSENHLCVPIEANLSYLDVAVVLGVWNKWGLAQLLASLLTDSADSGCAAHTAIAALVAQRCVAPDSKLAAERWFPTTALPELLEIDPRQFNNTRIHRLLEQLDTVEGALQARLPNLVSKHNGPLRATFLDLTDTWFVGRGPALAEKAKTKEGFVRKRIGIALLCNHSGYPLRWEVVSGKSQDGPVMARMLRELKGASWLEDVPLVCDRAMGKGIYVRQMASSGIRFLTALPRSEIEAYHVSLPTSAFEALEVGLVASKQSHERQQAMQVARGLGMTKVDERTFVLDLGIVDVAPKRPVPPSSAVVHPSEANGDDPLAYALKFAQRVQKMVENKEAPSISAASRELGRTDAYGRKVRRLLRLPEDIQTSIVTAGAKGVSFKAALRISAIDNRDEQRHAFVDAQHKAKQLEQRVASRSPSSELESLEALASTDNIKVRAVAYFNADAFVHQRLRANEMVREFNQMVEKTNTRWQAARSRLTQQSVHAELLQYLKRHDAVRLFEIRFNEHSHCDGAPLQAQAVLNQVEWQRRRRFDGFVVLVGHRELPGNAVELCRLYRSKNEVERDFETIKSVIELRPLWHRTDAKVRAHVSLCMLALLVHRSIEDQLADNGLHCRAATALATLATCHLNRLRLQRGDHVHVFTLTDATEEQRRILDALDLARLLDKEVIIGIEPR